MSTYMAKYRERRFYSTASKTGFRGFDGFDQFTIDQATYISTFQAQNNVSSTFHAQLPCKPHTHVSSV